MIIKYIPEEAVRNEPIRGLRLVTPENDVQQRAANHDIVAALLEHVRGRYSFRDRTTAVSEFAVGSGSRFEVKTDLRDRSCSVRLI
jgi:hypothetical protein